jgi:hypothetical protein
MDIQHAWTALPRLGVWIFFMRSTVMALGALGVVLLVALFATIVRWVVSQGWLDPEISTRWRGSCSHLRKRNCGLSLLSSVRSQSCQIAADHEASDVGCGRCGRVQVPDEGQPERLANLPESEALIAQREGLIGRDGENKSGRE